MHINEVKGLGITPLLPRKKDFARVPPAYLVCIDDNCSGNAIMNKSTFESLSGSQVHVVCGSFGVVKDNGDIWWEWGTGRENSPEQEFLVSSCDSTKQNCHFWLENDNGDVFDIVPTYITNIVVPVHTARVDLSQLVCQAVVTGQSKATLRGYGLVYVPAEKSVQHNILKHRVSRLRFVPL